MVENRKNRLDSWKAIAEYLGRDIRTAIRWEREKGLPVYRIPGGKRQLVFGFTDEIDSWLKDGAASNPPGNGSDRRQSSAASNQSAQVVSAPVAHYASVPRRPRWVRWAVWGSGGLVLLALLGLGGYEWRQRHVDRTARLLERQLTANPSENGARGAAISPDGKHVAYSDFAGVFVRSTDSGEIRAVSLPPELQSPPVRVSAWFPDGGSLLGIRNTAEGAGIWKIPILGTAAPRMVYRFGEEATLSPDGQSIAFVNGEAGKQGRELWVGGIDGRPPRKLAT